MFKEEVLILFEDDESKAPKEYDKLLNSMYGDYMTPPSKGQRKINIECSRYLLETMNKLSWVRLL